MTPRLQPAGRSDPPGPFLDDCPSDARLGDHHTVRSQRTHDRCPLCAGGAGAHADLRRAAHHQFRPWGAADAGALCGLLPEYPVRHRPLRLAPHRSADHVRARLCASARHHRQGGPRPRREHPAGDARPRHRDREPVALFLPLRHAHRRHALFLRDGGIPRRLSAAAQGGRLFRRPDNGGALVAAHGPHRSRPRHPRARQGAHGRAPCRHRHRARLRHELSGWASPASASRPACCCPAIT